MLRVRLDVAISATVVLDLVGAEDAPGVKEGGVLEQVARELTIEALPTDIPDAIHHDVSTLVIGDTVTLDAVDTAPRGHARSTIRKPSSRRSRRPSFSSKRSPESRRRPSSWPRARPARRPRRKPPRKPPATAKAGTRASSPPEPRCRAKHLSRLAGRRPRESGRRVRRHPSQHRVRGCRRARDKMVAAEGQVEVPRAADRRPHRAGWTARRDPQADDLHERGRRLS